jgi:hypothetical protein
MASVRDRFYPESRMQGVISVIGAREKQDEFD